MKTYNVYNASGKFTIQIMGDDKSEYTFHNGSYALLDIGFADIELKLV